MNAATSQLYNTATEYDFDMSKLTEEQFINLMADRYTEALQKLQDANQIESFTIKSFQTEWSSWSLSQRIIWTIADIFGIRKLMLRLYTAKLKELKSKSYKTGIEAVDAVSLYEEKYYRFWYSPTPDKSIKADIFFKPTKPIEYVQVDITVDKKPN
jgi:hypothetical protein